MTRPSWPDTSRYLEGIDPREYRRAEQMAYWINFYNARTVKMVLDAYPVDTIREIHQGDAPMTGPWKDVCANVAGRDLTLDQIEHDILRPIWRDKRIHYAVNCAAYSCPQLMDTAFTAANTESLLEAGARAYVNSARGVDVVDDEFMVLSSIYKWYPEDFGEFGGVGNQPPRPVRRRRVGGLPGRVRGHDRLRLRLETEPGPALITRFTHTGCRRQTPLQPSFANSRRLMPKARACP